MSTLYGNGRLSYKTRNLFLPRLPCAYKNYILWDWIYLPDFPSGERKQKLHPSIASSQAPTTKEYYLQERYNESICGLTLDHIQRKQLKTMFNALVEFIESKKEITPPKQLNYKFFISKIFALLFPSEKNIPPPKQTNEKNQMLWNSFLVYHNISISSKGGSPTHPQ